MIGSRLISVITSPRAKPRSSAKLAGSTSVTTTPRWPSMPTRAARSGVRLSTRSPNSAGPDSPCLGREDTGAVLDHSGGFLLRTVTNIVELHFASERSGSDGVDQIVASLHRCAVLGGDGVATLESGFFRRATGFDVHDHYTVRRAQFLQGNRIGAEIFLEAYADGAAGYASLRNDLVVDIDGGSRRQ